METKETAVDVSKGYADVLQDAKSFYAEVESKGGSALDKMRELDPPQVDRDAEMITRYEDRVKAGMAYPCIPGSVGAVEIRKHAEGRVTLNRWINKAAAGEPLLTVKDFFTNSAVTSLFPAYVEARIQQARLGTSLVGQLIFADETVDSVTKVTVPYIADTEVDRQLSEVGEGADLPATTIRVADSNIVLRKYGRQLRWTYEAIASQSIDAVGNMIGRIGIQLGIDETNRLLHIAIAGDGTTMGAAETNATDVDVAVAGTITYADLCSWFYGMYNTTVFNAYTIDRAVICPADALLLAQLGQFQDPELMQGLASIRLPSPVSVQYLIWPGSIGGSSYLDRMIVGMDSRAGFVAYTYGGFISEAGRMIERQIDNRTFSYWRGFRKWDTNAVLVLDTNAVL